MVLRWIAWSVNVAGDLHLYKHPAEHLKWDFRIRKGNNCDNQHFRGFPSSLATTQSGAPAALALPAPRATMQPGTSDPALRPSSTILQSTTNLSSMVGGDLEAHGCLPSSNSSVELPTAKEEVLPHRRGDAAPFEGTDGLQAG